MAFLSVLQIQHRFFCSPCSLFCDLVRSRPQFVSGYPCPLLCRSYLVRYISNSFMCNSTSIQTCDYCMQCTKISIARLLVCPATVDKRKVKYKWNKVANGNERPSVRLGRKRRFKLSIVSLAKCMTYYLLSSKNTLPRDEDACRKERKHLY